MEKTFKAMCDLDLGRTVPNVELILDFLIENYAMLYLNFMIIHKSILRDLTELRLFS